MARLLRNRPALAAQLMFAPPRNVHGVCAFLSLHPLAAGSDAEVAAMLEQDPRDLLKLALPDAPARLYRALDRTGNIAHSGTYYQRLCRLANSHLGHVILDKGTGPITERSVGKLERLLTMHPVIQKLPKVLEYRGYHLHVAQLTIQLALTYGVLSGEEILHCQQNSLRSLAKWLIVAIDKIKTPDVGFVVGAGYRVLTSIGEVRRVGRMTFKNCLGNFDFSDRKFHDMAQGHLIFIEGFDPPLIAEVRQILASTWTLGEVRDVSNAPVDDDDKNALIAALELAGLIIMEDAWSTLATLHYLAEKKAGAAENDDAINMLDHFHENLAT
jgi:hypothetical protein